MFSKRRIMHTTRSADGTMIAYESEGSGPALVLVTGAFCDRASSAGIAALLTPYFTVHRYDRRGRGDSGDTLPYSTDREIEDLRSVIDAAGGSAHVYGHSAGARLALDAASAGLSINKLAVYEPPFLADDSLPRATDLRIKVENLLADGNRREAAVLHLVESGTPQQVVDYMQAAPWWPAMEALAHTLPYDEALCGDLTLPIKELSGIELVTLVLGGADSSPSFRAAMGAVAETIPTARHRELDGQGHVAADEVLAPILIEFFRSSTS
jgi:pimeloyl-ACP methyl ester carboxylesterase